MLSSVAASKLRLDSGRALSSFLKKDSGRDHANWWKTWCPAVLKKLADCFLYIREVINGKITIAESITAQDVAYFTLGLPAFEYGRMDPSVRNTLHRTQEELTSALSGRIIERARVGNRE